MAPYRLRTMLRALLGLAVMMTTANVRAEARPTAPRRARLRADIANASDSNWSGSFQLSAGQIVSARLTDLRAGYGRKLELTSPTALRFDAAGPTAWCTLEFEIEAPDDACSELVIDGHRLRATLADLLQGAETRSEWSGWATLRRDPADTLQVQVNRPHLIFAPGEQADFDLIFNFFTAEAQQLKSRLRIEMHPARDTAVLRRVVGELDIPTNAAEPPRRLIQVPVPDQEGVYDVWIRVEPAGLRPVERTVQLVVLNPNATAARSAELAPRTIQEIDPTLIGAAVPWYSTRRLWSQTTRLGQFLRGRARRTSAHEDDTPIGQFRLNVQNLDRPHLLSIEFEDGGPPRAITISESDPDGRSVQAPIASGFMPSGTSAAGPIVHQVVFWPQTKSPSLAVHCDGAAGTAGISKLRLAELPQGLPPLEAREPDAARRLFGLYVDDPDSWQGVGSSRLSDAATGLALDDWRTFLNSISHLADYARFAGYNCVMPTVVGHGGTLYPSRLIEPGLRLDSGSLATLAPDPVRKDVVELLYRVCERSRLGVVPAIRFDAPITSIEQRLCKADPRVSGELVVSRDGLVWDDLPGTDPQLPRRYNPLNPHVQAAMIDVVREFVERYGRHVGFEGIAIDLANESHAVLPGLDWGYDDATVEQFSGETGIALPPLADDDATRFARRFQFLTGPERDRWTAWRGRQLVLLHDRMLAEIQQAKPAARLVIGLAVPASSGGDDRRDAARAGRTVEEALRGKGIDLRAWPARPEVLVLSAFPATSSSAESSQTGANRELDELLARLPARGSICLHAPETLRLSGATDTADSRTRPNDTITVPVVPGGRSSLRRFARTLAAGDCQAIFDGGPVIPLGQEQVGREFARVFRSLPTGPFQSVETLQPVIVRSSQGPRDSTVYLVNDATYAVETNLSLDCPIQTILTDASTGERVAATALQDGLGAKLSLQPFQTVALRLARPEVSVAQCNVVVPTAAESGLKARFDRLSQAMVVLGRDAGRTLDGVPPNGDFEESTRIDREVEVPPHWRATGETSRVLLDAAAPHSGQRSLRLSGPAGSAVASEPFAAAVGRSLALKVWLRADRPNLRLRWSLAVHRDGEVIYHCFADVTVGTDWEQKQFRAPDMPEAQIDDVVIKFELLGEGATWIDDARVCALAISNDEQKAISKSVSAIFRAWKERRLSDFERLADGYWATYLVESVEGTRRGKDEKALKDKVE